MLRDDHDASCHDLQLGDVQRIDVAARVGVRELL